MSSTNVYRDTVYAGPIPSRGTYPAAANKLFPKGTIVQKDASDRATPGAAGNGFPAVGVSNATYNNLTGSEYGGAAGAIDVEVLAGVFGFDYTGTPEPGQTVFVEDNQTVSDDSDGGANGVAGVCTELRDGQCFVYVGPLAAGLFSDDSAVEADVVAAQADIDALQADALSAKAKIDLPIMSAITVAAGVGVSAAAPSTSVPGTAMVDAKSAAVKWLAHATPGAIALNVAVPADLDDAHDVIFHALVSKSGATVGDATTLTLDGFEVVPGALHDADTDFATVTGAVVGNATAKTVTELTATFALADIHAYPEGICLTIKPTNGTLGTDNFYLHAAWLEYTRKLRTS
jgi:hypothetical protein